MFVSSLLKTKVISNWKYADTNFQICDVIHFAESTKFCLQEKWISDYK